MASQAGSRQALGVASFGAASRWQEAKAAASDAGFGDAAPPPPGAAALLQAAQAPPDFPHLEKQQGLGEHSLALSQVEGLMQALRKEQASLKELEYVSQGKILSTC